MLLNYCIVTYQRIKGEVAWVHPHMGLLFIGLAQLQGVILWLGIPRNVDVVVGELVAEMKLVLQYRVARF